MLAATALDGRYRVLLNPIQVDSAKTMLMELVSVHRYIDIIMCVQIMSAWHSIVASELTLTQIPMIVVLPCLKCILWLPLSPCS